MFAELNATVKIVQGTQPPGHQSRHSTWAVLMLELHSQQCDALGDLSLYLFVNATE